MICGVNGKRCFLVALISMHHSNLKEFVKSDLHGLLVNYCAKLGNKISLKRREFSPIIQLHGTNLNGLEIRQMTVKLAKKHYVSDNLNANKGNSRKTWKVINELTSRNSGKSANILEIKADHRIVNDPMDRAETIYEHFSNVAQVLAHDIPLVDVNAESYLERTDCLFSLQTLSVSIVLSFLKKIDEKKATGLDRIPSKLLKMADSINAPSLTSIFSKSILTGIYPNDWKAAKVTPLLNKRQLQTACGCWW